MVLLQSQEPFLLLFMVCLTTLKSRITGKLCYLAAYVLYRPFLRMLYSMHAPSLSSLQLWFPFLLHIAEKNQTVSKRPTVPRQLAFSPSLLWASLSEPIHHPLYGREEGCSGTSLRYSNSDLQIGRVIHHPGQAGSNSRDQIGCYGAGEQVIYRWPVPPCLLLKCFQMGWRAALRGGKPTCTLGKKKKKKKELPVSTARGNRVNVPFKGKFGW